jgi:diguanylate cyclase (GGDEF)-like protein
MINTLSSPLLFPGPGPCLFSRISKHVGRVNGQSIRRAQESAYLSASVGIAFYPNHGEDMDSLIKSADRTMYDAKNSGRNRFVIANDS